MMNKNVLKNAVKVAMYGKPFYASDLELCGGNINGLLYHDLIKPTGNTKKIWVEIYEDTAKKCEVSEWIANFDEIRKLKKNIEKDIASLTSQLEILNMIA